MDEMAYYIFNYCFELLTKEENQAHKNLLGQQKTDSSENQTKKEILRKSWLSDDKDVLKLLENGSEEFYKRTVERVFKDNPNKEFLNLCPKCNALTKTPKARQCRKCFYSWHEDTENES
ncbi:hypothetical protein BH20ACI4_BH20ACI4_30170 [soil metagenome]